MAGEYYNQLMQIKEAYENLEKKIWLEGKMIYKKTEAGIFVPTDISRFYNLCKYLNMQDFKSYLELGSGDGRITRAASIFTKATGIEIDKELHKRALSIGNVPQGRKIGEDIFFIHGNYMDYDFSDYDIIYWA
ncbi:MAG: class I SAM-dependent methyltransferase, partial [Candidatus Woesearchaeota archaeon]|nr:class I SAM-dependent methyltransferase [Candidatus Woesearchaeota archaeon]